MVSVCISDLFYQLSAYSLLLYLLKLFFRENYFWLNVNEIRKTIT